MVAIRWFEEIGLTDVALVGGKGANLGQLTAAGLPVPPGFVVTADAYLDAVSESRVRARLARLMRRLNADDHASFAETHQTGRDEILATTIPAEIADAIANAYRSLGDDVAVAVRRWTTAKATVAPSPKMRSSPSLRWESALSDTMAPHKTTVVGS